MRLTMLPKIEITFNEKQRKKFKKWYKSLPKEEYGKETARLEYIISYNGIGEEVVVRDKVSNTQIDLTDISSW